MNISNNSSRDISSASESSSISENDEISRTEIDKPATKSPKIESKKNESKEIKKIKDDWSQSVKKMELHLADVEKLLNEINVLLEELDNTLSDDSPNSSDDKSSESSDHEPSNSSDNESSKNSANKKSSTYSDLIASFRVAIKKTKNLKEQLREVNKAISDLSIPSAKVNKKELEIITKIKDKMEETLAFKMSSTTPKNSNRHDLSDNEDQPNNSAEEGDEIEINPFEEYSNSFSNGESETSSNGESNKKNRSTDKESGREIDLLGQNEDSSSIVSDSENSSAKRKSKESNKLASQKNNKNSPVGDNTINVRVENSTVNVNAGIRINIEFAESILKLSLDNINKYDKNKDLGNVLREELNFQKNMSKYDLKNAAVNFDISGNLAEKEEAIKKFENSVIVESVDFEHIKNLMRDRINRLTDALQK